MSIAPIYIYIIYCSSKLPYIRIVCEGEYNNYILHIINTPTFYHTNTYYLYDLYIIITGTLQYIVSEEEFNNYLLHTINTLTFNHIEHTLLLIYRKIILKDKFILDITL